RHTVTGLASPIKGETMKKRLTALLLTATLAAAATVSLGVAPAAATPPDCVPSNAWTEEIIVSEAHWQRYSWTGGPYAADTPPAFPGSDWQANVAGDPHNIGVEGAYYR